MKEVVYSCDYCHKQVEIHNLSGFVFQAKRVEICKDCQDKFIQRYLNHSCFIVLLQQCKTCKGQGRVKDYTGCHNDYNWVHCPECGGRKDFFKESV